MALSLDQPQGMSAKMAAIPFSHYFCWHTLMLMS